jgi:thiol-disulfide isomerase/thioredoxin
VRRCRASGGEALTLPVDPKTTLDEPTLAEVQALSGWTLLEFGASWCGYCQAARPLVDAELSRHREVKHLWVEDG